MKSMKSMPRSTQILALGIATSVLGAGLVFLTLTAGDDDASAQPTATQAGAVPEAAAPAGGAPAPPTTGAPTAFTIPKGKQAVAVQLGFVAGLAGYAKPGDHVNIYATVEKGEPNAPVQPPLAKLVLADVEVLAVNSPAPGAGDGKATYLLALDAAQAEQAIFFSRFESTWMTLVPEGQSPATTPGRSYTNAF
ncbi:MAG: RcpC/CpaB family pilus assembly protein [Acidimicrobiia bacterium]